MAIVPDPSSSSTAEDTDFGANDWLLEEMYEQYSKDPGSVDGAWAAYFSAHGAPGEAPAQRTPRPGARPPRPRRRPSR